MDIYKLLLLQFIAHLLADFTFQNDEWSEDKKRFRFKSAKLYYHVLIVFGLSWFFSFQWNFFLFSLVISIVHFFADAVKFRIAEFKIGRRKLFKNYIFLIDQFIHIGLIVVIVIIYNSLLDISPVVNITLTTHRLLIIAGYLLCLKPSNIFIREILTIYKIEIDKNPGNELINAGRLIGNIERILTLTLILMSQYNAIGFLLAAKSIIRYESVKTSKTEYVLIGSLMSFGIAIIIGITILKIHI